MAKKVNKTKLFWTIGVIAIIILAVAVPLSIRNSSEEKEVIKIGAVLPLTGPLSYLGEDELLGLEIALNEINEKAQKKIEIIIEDSQADPTIGVTAARKLLSYDDINILIISTSPVSLAVAPLQDYENFLMIADTIDNSVAKKSPYIFRPKLGEVETSKRLANMITKKGKKFAILTVHTDWAVNAADAFELEVESLGGEIVIKEFYEKGKTDFRTELTKIKEKNAEGIFYLDYAGPSTANFYKQREELKMINITVYGEFLSGYGTFFNFDPEQRYLMENVVSFIWPSTYEFASNDSATVEFVKKYEFEYKDKVKDFDVQYSYTYLKLLFQILERCGWNDNPECLANELKKIKEDLPYESIVGPIFFDDDGNCNYVAKFARLINGSWEEIK